MKTRFVLLMTLVSLFSLGFASGVLADHEWLITGVTCDPGTNTITIYGNSTTDTSNDTRVYVDGSELGYYNGGDFTDGPVSFTVTDPSIVEGAVIVVENPTTSTSATTVCGADAEETSGEVSYFEPGDDRINPHAYAPIAVYCADAGLEILSIDAQGEGFSAIFIASSELPAAPSAEAGNQLIQTAGNIQLYQTTTGEFLARVGPDAEGKYYRLFWNGCPATYVQAAIEQGDKITVTEVFPR